MSKGKRFQVAAIILTAALVFMFTVALDLSRFFGFYDFYNSYPNDLLKRINVLLAAALVWMAGKNSLGQKDNRHMKLVFIVICIGEIFFLLAKPEYAIGSFAICQYLLIFRHGKGLIPMLKSAARLRVILTMLSLIMICALVAMIFLVKPFEKEPALSLEAFVYWIILSISLLTALASPSLGYFPKINSRMIAIGMMCFYCCDILVGLDMLLPKGTAWMLANSFIWIFYTPAITLLALSCYRYEEKSFHINEISIAKQRALK